MATLKMFYKRVLRSKVNSCVFPHLTSIFNVEKHHIQLIDGKYFPMRHLGFTASQDDKDHFSVVDISGFSQLHGNW